MKRIITISVAILLMFVCFAASGLYFLNTGIIDPHTDTVNEKRVNQIINDLNEIPFVSLDNFTFTASGEVIAITNTTITIDTGDEQRLFETQEKVSMSDLISVFYQYDENEIVVVRVKVQEE